MNLEDRIYQELESEDAVILSMDPANVKLLEEFRGELDRRIEQTKNFESLSNYDQGRVIEEIRSKLFDEIPGSKKALEEYSDLVNLSYMKSKGKVL